VKVSLDAKVKAVFLYVNRIKRASEIRETYGIPERTLRRWARAYRDRGVHALEPKKPGPKHAPSNSIDKRLEWRILELKQKHPSWGTRRIKYQYVLPCHWRTVHDVIKRHGMMVRIKKKPQPKPKRFRRKHVDSMWQGDTFSFRISGVGKVYVTGFLDDCSNYRVASGVYLHRSTDESLDSLQHALARGRVPREMYLDNRTIQG
jgi:transposase